MPDGLIRMVWLVLEALRLLQLRAHAAGIVAAADQARAAVAELPADLTSTAFTLVLDAIEDYRRGEDESLFVLENRLTAALVMLRLTVTQCSG
jgi:hypothetical protein